MQGVQTFQANTNNHVAHSDDNTDLHFEGIHESDFVRGLVPNIIKTKWVLTCLLDQTFPFITGSKKWNWEREEVIVNQSTIYWENAHDQKQGANSYHLFGKRIWFEVKKHCENKKCWPVSYVSEHSSEHIRKPDDCKKSWICFFISRHSVSIYYFLKRLVKRH